MRRAAPSDMGTLPLLRPALALCIPILLIPLMTLPAGVASAVSPQAQELEEVLREMRQVESEIERYLIEEAGRPTGARTEPAPSPGAAASPEPAPATPRQEELEAWGLSVSDELQAVARARTEARARLDAAESGLKLSTALLVKELEREDGDPAMQLTLGIMQARHRASANLAVEQLLRLEQVRFQRRPAKNPEAAAPRTAPAPSPAEPSRLEELRRRHREISSRLSELSDGAETGRPPARQFREQRAQLNALMARLSREDGTAPPLTPGVSTPRSPEAGDLVPERPAVEDKDGRRIFWRASRAKIHAIQTGKVIFAGPFAGYRHLLILDHGDGWTSLYGNMTDCYVRVDDVMSRGSVLGEYQAEHIGEPEPFWVEVRQGPQPVPIGEMPGVGEDLNRAIFGETPNR